MAVVLSWRSKTQYILIYPVFAQRSHATWLWLTQHAVGLSVTIGCIMHIVVQYNKHAPSGKVHYASAASAITDRQHEPNAYCIFCIEACWCIKIQDLTQIFGSMRSLSLTAHTCSITLPACAELYILSLQACKVCSVHYTVRVISSLDKMIIHNSAMWYFRHQ